MLFLAWLAILKRMRPIHACSCCCHFIKTAQNLKVLIELQSSGPATGLEFAVRRTKPYERSEQFALTPENAGQVRFGAGFAELGLGSDQRGLAAIRLCPTS